MSAPTEKARLKAPKTCAVEIAGVSAATIESSSVIGVMKKEIETPAQDEEHQRVRNAEPRGRRGAGPSEERARTEDGEEEDEEWERAADDEEKVSGEGEEEAAEHEPLGAVLVADLQPRHRVSHSALAQEIEQGRRERLETHPAGERRELRARASGRTRVSGSVDANLSPQVPPTRKR